jgi:hypothetical protein
MKNSTVCNNCKTENPFYETICKNCKSYLRDKVYNIDLSRVLARLIETPANGFKLIIFSEHKNFVTFLIFLLVLKLEIDSIFISLFFTHRNAYADNFIGIFAALLILITLLFFLFSYILNILNNAFGYVTRTKDNFSILIYSFVPCIFALAVLFPVELVLFGEYLFSANPSPFDLKEFAAYSLLILEILIVFWSLFLTIMANYAQTKNFFYSLIISIIFHSLLFFMLYSFPKLV